MLVFISLVPERSVEMSKPSTGKTVFFRFAAQGWSICCRLDSRQIPFPTSKMGINGCYERHWGINSREWEAPRHIEDGQPTGSSKSPVRKQLQASRYHGHSQSCRVSPARAPQLLESREVRTIFPSCLKMRRLFSGLATSKYDIVGLIGIQTAV